MTGEWAESSAATSALDLDSGGSMHESSAGHNMILPGLRLLRSGARLFAWGNLVDPATNLPFVEHVLRTDTTCGRPG